MEGWPVGFLHNAVEELNSGKPRTNRDRGGVKDFKEEEPPDFKSSGLDHSADAASTNIRVFCDVIFHIRHGDKLMICLFHGWENFQYSKTKQSKQTHTQKDKNNGSATMWSIHNHLHVKRGCFTVHTFWTVSLNFSGSWFVIRFYFLHPKTSLFLYALLLSHWCFSILKNYHFQPGFFILCLN